MGFVDIATVTLQAGHGGAGAVSFRKEKYIAKGGPDGGDGGQGGDIIVIAKPYCQTLMDLRFKKRYQAEHGHPGRAKTQFGKAGHPLIIHVPCGTNIYDDDDHDTLLADLTTAGDTFVATKGGRGGKGNAHFSTARHQTPRFSQSGHSGQKRTLFFELKLLANIGLVGLPNAGKSTLLKILTGTSPKIAAYPFSTKQPNLGLFRQHDKELIVADIPGLLEGASHGVGLGNAFLRHISRTELLLHLISVTYQTPDDCLNHYHIIINELKESGILTRSKPIVTVLSQIDTLNNTQLHAIETLFKQHRIPILTLSAITNVGLTTLKNHIWNHFS